MARSREVERRRVINKALRQVRASYRIADTAGEKLERELDRLIKRKTTVEIEDINTLERLGQDWYNKVNAWATSYATLPAAIVNT